MKIILRAYKFRLYPNKEQIEYFQNTFGCCRFIYNHMLADKIDYYEQNHKSITITPANYKNNYEFLKQADSLALCNEQMHLQTAFKNFFERKESGFPKFKSKHNNYKSYTTNNQNGTIAILDNNHIKLPKIKSIRCKVHRTLLAESRIKSATISQVPSGKYYVSLLVEETYFEESSTGCCIGFDLGIKDLIITSEGQKFDNIKLVAKYSNQLAKEQRKFAKMVKGSNNYNKQRIEVAKIYEKITNKRKDYLHKISHKLIIENQVIVSEKLKVSNMVKNHKLAKSISDCSWSTLTNFVSYKSEWNDRDYIQIDTFFPSSKTCSNCGYKLEELELDVREWTCPSCGRHHGRDINAAINILNEGLRIYNS